MGTFKVLNLGCKVNRAESDDIEMVLLGSGMHPADSECSIVVVNTCTVTSTAEKKTRKAVRRMLADNPDAKVVVTGCAAAQNELIYSEMSERVEVVAKWDLEDRIREISVKYRDQGAPVSQNAIHHRVSEYCRANVKVQDGCSNECSYCIIHTLRGPETSTDPAKVLDRVHMLANSGIKEIMLSGINLGKYDHGGNDLADLCAMLVEGCDDCRFRLSSIEPNDLTDDVIDAVAASKGRICRHFHLPLQSGCDETLFRMNRRYGASDFREVVERIRDRIPKASISTDVICGFPGESDSEFEETLAFCEEMAFSKMHVFPFSARSGTPAFDMDAQIPSGTKSVRAKRLRRLAADMRDRDLASRKGDIERCVVEDERWCMSESYHRLRCPEGSLVGSFVEMRL